MIRNILNTLEDRNKILKAREENDTFYVIKTVLMIGDLSSKTVEARRQQWISILKMLQKNTKTFNLNLEFNSQQIYPLENGGEIMTF